MHYWLRKLVIFFFTFLSFASLSATQLFYLSTEKTFSNDENKRIKLESGFQVKALQVRVYQLKDPEGFYATQENFHRPQVGNRQFRKQTLDIGFNFIQDLKSGMREWIRNEIPTQNRRQGLKFLPDLKTTLDGTPGELGQVIRPLDEKNYGLLHDFVYHIPGFDKDWNYNYIFLDNLKEGIYLVEAIYKNQVGYTVLNISDFGFVVKKSEQDLLVYATGNKNGAPQENVHLTFFDGFRKKLKALQTDAKGIASTKLPQNELFILGKSRNNTYAFYDPQFYPMNFSHTKVYMYTDRPVYKGGDTVNFKGLVRNLHRDLYSAVNTAGVKVEIISSRGEVLQSVNTQSPEQGSFFGEFKLPSKAQAGRYLLLADLNGKKYEAEFKVEYYQKPEFEVIVKPATPFLIGGQDIKATIMGKYYFGAPVKNAKVRYSIYRTRFSGEAFESEQDESFYLSEQEYQQSQLELLKNDETTLNENGLVNITYPTKKEPMGYTYQIKATVINDANLAIAGSGNVKVVPSAYRVEVKAHKFVYELDEEIPLTIKASDYSNKAVSTDFEVNVSTEEKNGDVYVFIDKKVKTDKKGNADLTFKAVKTGFVKIQVEGSDDEGNKVSTVKYIWIGQSGASYSYAGGLVKLILDKSYYKVGDTAKLLVLSPVPELEFLFTLEGDTIYEHSVKKFEQNSLLISIPIKDERYLPNIFATVSFLFNNQLYENTIKLDIPAIEKTLKIAVKPMQDQYKPRSTGKAVAIVTDQNNKPVANAEVSIAVVDEAIYGISKEIAVDIRKFFYPFRRNNVRTWSSIGFRFYGYSLQVKENQAARLGQPLGLAAFKGRETAERKEFKDAILWLPVLKTNSKGEAAFDIPFPDNITKWRMSAVAITKDTKVGRSQGHVITKQDFFINVAHSPFLNEKDEATIYSTLHNYSGKKLSAKVVLQAENLKIAQDTQNVAIEPDSTQVLSWKVTPQEVKPAKITITALAGTYQDRISKPITIIPHSINKNLYINKLLDNGQDSFNFDLPEKLKKETLTLDLNLSYGYFSTIQAALPYLVSYPWGCVEQVTSSFLPTLTAIRGFKDFGISMPELEKKLPDIVNDGLAKLYGYQNQNGSWGWQDPSKPDIYMSAYVLYALTLTDQLGFAVDKNVLNKGIRNLTSNIGKTATVTERIFALYVLSLNRKFFPSLLERVLAEPKLSSYDLSLLALTQKNSNLMEPAKKTLTMLKKQAIKDNNTLFWGLPNTYYWYQDSVETTAWAIRAIAAIDYDAEMIASSVAWLMLNKQGTIWKSTRDTSAVIYTLSELLKKQDFNAGVTLGLLLNGQEIGTIRFNKQNFQGTLSLAPQTLNALLKPQGNTLSLKNLSDKDKIFLSFSLNYHTAEKNIEASNSGFEIAREYYTLEEKESGEGLKYALGSRTNEIKKSTPLLVKLTVNSAKPYQYFMLRDFYPAGCQPIKDFLIYQIEGLESRIRPDFIDFKEDQVAFFADRFLGKMEVYYVLNTSLAGKYQVLPAQGELMYFPAIRGNSPQDELLIGD